MIRNTDGYVSKTQTGSVMFSSHLPKKSQIKTFLKSLGDLNPCWNTCSRAETSPLSPHSKSVRLPLCQTHKAQAFISVWQLRHKKYHMYLLNQVLNKQMPRVTVYASQWPQRGWPTSVKSLAFKNLLISLRMRLKKAISGPRHHQMKPQKVQDQDCEQVLPTIMTTAQ